jgi:hypothetical protein
MLYGMTQKRSTSLHYEQRLHNLKDYLHKELNRLREFDPEYDAGDNARGFSAVTYFETIKSKMDSNELNSSEAFEDVSKSLDEYVPQMIFELQSLGDEMIASDVYEEWIEVLADKKAPQEYLAYVIKKHGGDFITDTRQRNQHKISWQAFVKSVDVLIRQFGMEKEKDINPFAAMDIEAFILEHGAASLMLCATTTSNGLGKTRVPREREEDTCEFYYSYATEAMDCYYKALELLDKTSSPHQNVNFVHQVHPPLSDIVSRCKEARYYLNEKKVIVSADTLNEYNCLFYSLQTLKKYAPLKTFYHDVHQFIPPVLDSFRKNGEGFRCVDIANQTIDWLHNAEDERHGFVETICTRETAELIKGNFLVNACDLMASMKDAFELPQMTMLILTDPQEEAPTPIAAMAGWYGGSRQETFDEDCIIAIQSRKILLRDSTDNTNAFMPIHKKDAETIFRVAHFENEVMKIPMYIGTGEARPIGKHLYMCMP